MKVMAKGMKPKVGPKRMPAEVLELTQAFKKQYDSKDLNQLWGAMIACYGTEKLAIQAAYENPQIVNPSVSIAAIESVHRRRRVDGTWSAASDLSVASDSRCCSSH